MPGAADKGSSAVPGARLSWLNFLKQKSQGISNRVRPPSKTPGLRFSTTWGDCLRFRLEFLRIDPLNALWGDFYPGLWFPNSHVAAGGSVEDERGFVVSVFLG